MSVPRKKPDAEALTEIERDMLKLRKKLDKLHLYEAAAHVDLAFHKLKGTF